ncbi:hypothetical protein CC78DRAFT_502185 [Lojkania enalia]|uniref:UBC core domain-containing protein n=1 Tax=Lojkania enalia TaxID=147567 RepID=A0A9P4N5Z7_9PLEO|nr:hypothetical protein CC78DRAFT_502185 [Didymosphaeria enalia]
MDGDGLRFCVEDSVGLKDDMLVFGVVDRTFGDVDSHEPRPQRDYLEDIERHNDISREQFNKFMKTGIPPQGTVLVSWQTEEKTELIPEAKLELLDRALYVGDVVKRNATNPMSGTVIGTRAICTLLPTTMRPDMQRIQNVVDELAIRCVPADELINVHEYVEGALVIYNDWVGRIDHVYDEVTVKLLNNSVVVVESPDDLEPEDPNVDRLSIGDRVTTKKKNLRRGCWKYGAFDPNVRPFGIVVETRTTMITVHWLARRFLKREATAADTLEPPNELYTDELESAEFHIYDAARGTLGTLPVSSNGTDPSYHVAEVAIGDRVRFKDVTAAAVKYDGKQTLPSGVAVGKLRTIPRTETLGYDMNVFIVVQTHTHVTVQWQDLSITEDNSSNLIPDPNVGDDDEVWPGEIVCTKEQRRLEDSDVSWTNEPAKVGVVQSVKSRDRIATVKWFESPRIRFLGEDLIPPAETGKLSDIAEEVSLYDIRSTPSLTRRRGDFVLIHPDSSLLTANGELASNANDMTSWFGEVIDLGLEGYLTIRLGAAKPVTDVRVQIERVTLVYSSDMDSHLDFMPELDEETEEEADENSSEFESASFNEMWVEYEGMDGEPVENSNEDDWSTEDEETDEDTSMPDLEHVEDIDTSKTTPEFHSDTERKEAHMLLDQTSPTSTSLLQSIPGPFPNTSASMPALSENATHVCSSSLVSFLILDSPPPPNHHYHQRLPASSSTLMRRIAKEHKILRNSLPPGIFVRTWESRLDLLRVLMVGPSDTPYEYAPFIIDFHLDSTYPSQAPEAFFHSWTEGNGPVNPNLYEDGKICLSLLGTWHADESNESWSPGKSTLLQVLVSIMGLVLVKEPYYNEAGYDVHRQAPETKLASALYTERSYFRARAFIAYALSNDIQPFQNELRSLYLDQSEDAPQLLDRAIKAANAILERSEKRVDDGERDGLSKISLGAVVMLKRQVTKLEALRDNSS